MHINVLRGWYIQSPEAFLRCFDFTAIDTVKCLFFHLKLNTTLSFRFRRRPCLSVLAFSLCALPSLSVDSTAREGSSVLRRWIFGVNFSYSINSSLLFPHSQLTLTEKEERLIILIAFKDRGRMWRQSWSPSSSIRVWVTLLLLNNSGEAGNNLHAGLCSQVEAEVNICRIRWLFCRFWRLTCTAAAQQVVWKNNNLFFFFLKSRKRDAAEKSLSKCFGGERWVWFIAVVKQDIRG